MNHARFVIAACVGTGTGTIWLILSSYFAMRKSEALADDLRREL